MFRKQFIYIFICLFPLFLFSQISRESGRHLAKITARGVGKVDTRVDNMGYWRRMADSGFVYVTAMAGVPSAVFTGSRIESRQVTITDSPDVLIIEENSTQSENSVFINPASNLSLLNSNNSTTDPAMTLYGANYLLSDDGGATWSGSLNGAGGYNFGDPTTAISLDERHYVGYIDDASGQSVSYSSDGGSTWTPVVAGIVTSGSNNLLDKNHLWIDNSPGSSYEGNLYNAWTCFGGTNDTEIEISRSTDGGVNWSAQAAISTAVNAGGHNQGVNIQTGPAGEVYVTWAIYDDWPDDESSIGFTKSTDGGSSYSTATRIISNICGIRDSETSKDHRVNSFPSMAVDISGGANDGNIYIVWANHGVPGVNTGNDIDIYLIRSVDEGAAWSSPVRVNQDSSGLGNEHYFPWITCDPVTGELSVIFYDDRNVDSIQKCEVFVACSFDAGDSWEDFKVSDVAFTPAPIPYLATDYMGDYLGISAREGRVYPTWTDNRTGTALTYVSPFDLSPLPNANFNVSTTTPCINQTALFYDMTLKSPTSWLWTFIPASCTFVNGTDATSQNPQVQFNSNGDYSVQLLASNSEGSDTLLRANYISVNTANADFVVNYDNVVVNNNVVFTDQSTCTISSYSWNFGADASPATASTQGPHTVTYSSTGLKTVSLTLNDTITKTKTDYIEVFPGLFNMEDVTLATCTGVMYDPQGSSDYVNGQNVTMTIVPADTSKSIMAVFTAFGLEMSCACIFDWLKIYDGKFVSDSLLGTYCGTNIPDTVVAYRASGALTFQFHSDQNTDSLGWVAALSCVNTPPAPSPAYCIASAINCDEYISRVQFSSIDTVTACSYCGYGNYSDLFTKVSPGFSYPVTVTNGYPIYSEDQCGIWVDWNHDHDLTDTGEGVSITGNPGVGPYSAVIIPPVGARKGLTRMRIRIMWSETLSPCGSTNYGEVEDYSIYVGTPGLWEGGVAGAENDWNTPYNWDDGRLPTITTDVVIPPGSTYFPEVDGLFSCQELLIKDGASMTIRAGGVLNVTGNLEVGQSGSGVLVIDGGTCNVSGSVNVLPGSTVDLINGGVMNDNN